MTDFELVLVLLLVADALALTVLVMLQQGKGADVGAAFGSGSSNTMFGSAGSGTFLTKLTSWLAVGFFAIAFGLAYFAKERAAGMTEIGIPTVDTPLSQEFEGSGTGGMPGMSSDLPETLPESVQEAVEGAIKDQQTAPKSGSQSGSESLDSDVPEV